MSSTEKILVNIFERKNSIIEEIRQHSQSFDHYLASMCILQGLQVPPWIFSNEDPKEFKKEDIISGLLLPRPQPSVVFSGSISRYGEATVSTFNRGYAGNKLSVVPQFAHEDPCTSRAYEEDANTSCYSRMQTVIDDGIAERNRLSVIPQFSNEAPCTSYATEKLDVSVSQRMTTVDDGFNAGSRLSVIPQSADEDPCTSCAAEELGVTVSSPLVCEGVENVDQGHFQSLVRVQRSKSRQKALELRNSVKAVRNSSQNEDNLDGFCRGVEGSGVVSLRYDHADEAELCEPVNAENATCIEAATKAGEFGSCSQQVDSLIEQYIADDPTNIIKEDGFVLSLNKSIEPNNFTVLLQPVNSSVYANANCAAEEIGIGDSRLDKQNCFINTSGSRNFETSGRQLSSAKVPCNVSNFCHSASQVGYESVARSVEQPSIVDGWLQSDKPPCAVSGKSRRVEEVKHGTEQSNENDKSTYVGRITRSRSCRQKSMLVSDHLNLGESTTNAYKGGDDRTEATTYAQISSHFDIDNESSNLKANAFGSESKKEEVSDGSSSRYRGCAKSIKCTSECSNLDCFSGKNNTRSVGKQKQQFNPVDGSMTVTEDTNIAGKSCGVEGRVLDVKNIDDGTDASGGRINAYRSSGHQTANLEQLPMEEDASNIAKPTCSDVPQISCSGQEEAAEFQKALVSGQNILPFTECSNLVDLTRDNVAVMEAEIDCAKRVEAYPIFSGPASVEDSPGLEYDIIVADSDIESAGQGDPYSLNSDSTPDGAGAGLGKETLDSMHSAERALPMNPKELHFDDGQDFYLTETSDLELGRKEKSAPPEMRSSIPHHIPDNMTSVNHEEQSTSFAEIPLTKEQEVCEREKLKDTPCEVHLENSANLVHSKSFNSEPRNVDASHFENQITDSRLKGSLPCYKEEQNGGENSKELSTPDVVQSTKDEGKRQDVQLYITNQPDIISPILKAEKDRCCSEVRDRSASVSLLNEHLHAFSVSNPTELVAHWVSQALQTRTGEEANSISRALNASVQDVVEENNAHLQLEEKFEPGRTEPLIDSAGIDVEGSRNLSSISAMSPYNESQILTGTDQNMPELEGFVMGMNDDSSVIVDDGINFANVRYPSTGIKRASLIEQLCKSASLHTPLSHLSTTLGLHNKLSLYQSTPAGLLEGLQTIYTPTVNADTSMQFEASLNNEHDFVFPGSSSSDCLPSSFQSLWDIKNPFVSPVGEFWNGITSKPGSSGKRLSSNHELPSISEENECTDEMAKTLQEDKVTEDGRSVKREPLADITKSLNPLQPVCESEVLDYRCSVASVNQDYGGSHVSLSKENGRLLRSNVKRANGSLNSRTKLSEKLSLRRENSNIHKRESKRNNIVSNITSFVPLVQKQSDANITSKRDVKVKSLEAAEIARRNLEKKENDRKMRKEALQRERAQKEQENSKQMELDKEKKEEERKKKLADNAAKKRQREEEEKKERERKRKCVEEKRRLLAEEEEKKLRMKKENKELKFRAAEKKAFENKEPRYKLQKHENMEKAKGDNTEPTVASTNDAREISTIVRNSEESDGGEKLQVMSHTFEAIQHNTLDLNITEEKSYEISPYKSSDDEDDDEEEGDLRKSKFIPSWSSKNHLATFVSSQQKIDPESIFPLESFCNITEVLLPRRLLQNVAAK